MIKKYFVPIVGLMSFVSFVAFATAKTKSVPESEVAEEVNEVVSDDILPVTIPEPTPVSSTVDTKAVGERLSRAQPISTENLVSSPTTFSVVEETQEPIIIPVQYTKDQTDDDSEQEEQYSENFRYEDGDDDEDDD